MELCKFFLKYKTLYFFRDYSLPGGYRHIVVRPQDVEWKIDEYSDVTKPLVLSDLDKIRNVTLEKDAVSSTGRDRKNLFIFFKFQSMNEN